MTLLDEIEAEAWHILAAIYTQQRLVEGLSRASTRYDLADQLVALNALGEMLFVRVARLADKRKDARSVAMLLKRGAFPGPAADVARAAARFLSLAEPVLRVRHEQIAHMKPGILSSYEPQDLPRELLRAVESLVDLVDVARGSPLGYTYRVGSMEGAINLRASLQAGERVLVQ